MKEKNSLIRVVKQPDGVIAIDRTGKKNGRGSYICLNSDCFNKIRKTRRLEKGFRCAIPAEIYIELEKHF